MTNNITLTSEDLATIYEQLDKHNESLIKLFEIGYKYPHIKKSLMTALLKQIDYLNNKENLKKCAKL